MTLHELRAYLADPAKDGNPAILAARVVMSQRDRLMDRMGELNQLAGIKAEVEELKASVESYRKENERLRDKLAALTPAPWELFSAPLDRTTEAHAADTPAADPRAAGTAVG